METVDIFEKLNSYDKMKIVDLKKEFQRADEDDRNDIVDDIEHIIHPVLLDYAKELINKNGIPENGNGWGFRPSCLSKNQENIEIMLHKTECGKYKPSISSPYWNAPANGIDNDCAVPSAEEALAWGLAESYAYLFANKLFI